MKSLWKDEDAQAAVDRWGAAYGEPLALRTYSSRLIGADPALVLHGGGNTSVKATARDVLGEDVPALYVKGSGWDLGTIEPPGFSAVDLAYLRRMVRLPALSDEAMVNGQRTHLFDASAPNPSVEALLHAFLPHTFVDHSHADAILALTNRPNGAALTAEVLGRDVLIVPYVMPGFDLARACVQAFEAMPDCTAMVLLQHGLFTWGATAREAYERHIELVDRAEAFVRGHVGERAPRPAPRELDRADARAKAVLPQIRGALLRRGLGCVLDRRADVHTLARLADPRLDRWAAAGPITPDHVIRTKALPCVVRLADGADAAEAIDDALSAYAEAYRAYFARQSERVGGGLTQLDPCPRVLLVPGVGLLGVGKDAKAAAVCADIAERALMVKEDCEGLGPFEGLPEADLFDVEYWSLEQAKLGKGARPALQGKVVLVTGAAGAIGLGICEVLRADGAHLVLVDRDAEALARAVEVLGKGPALLTVATDVSDADAVSDAFDQAVLRFGGVDVVVPNAGLAHVASLVELDPADLDRLYAVNTRGVMLTLQAAARRMIAQGSGGDVVLVSSKNVLGPGADFGGYSATKAAGHQLARIAALELAPHGVRVNMVTPDAVFSGPGEVASGLWAQVGPARAASKGLAPADLAAHYQGRNLLGATITAADVGRAVRFFVTRQTPTTGAVLPVDGGVAGAMPR